MTILDFKNEFKKKNPKLMHKKYEKLRIIYVYCQHKSTEKEKNVDIDCGKLYSYKKCEQF